MNATGQHKSTWPMAVKIRLLERGMSIRDLAAKLDRPRSTVSRAINQGSYPRVRAEIRSYLKIKKSTNPPK